MQAFVRKPETVFRNLITNLGTGFQVPLFFLSGAFLGPIGLLFLLFPIFGFIGLNEKLRTDKNYSQLGSIIMGTSAAVLVLALTNFNAARYVATLLPVGFLLLLHTPRGFSLAAQCWLDKINLREKHPVSNQQAGNERMVNVEDAVAEDAKAEDARAEGAGKVNFWMAGLGILFLSLGLIANEQIIHNFVLPNQELPGFITRQITMARIFFVSMGALLLLLNKKITLYLHAIRTKSHVERISSILKKVELKGTSYLIIASTVVVLLTAHYPSGTVSQLQSVFTGQDFLSGQKPMSLADTYPVLTKHLNANTKVLVREYTWVMAFTEVSRDKVYQIWSLPPIHDSTGETEQKLKGTDVIMVSSPLESTRPLGGTQTYPRYLFHLKPFLEKARTQGWTEEKIEGYGTVYVRN